MFFNRSKAKTNRFSTFEPRSVEAETIKRWKEIASRKYPAEGPTEAEEPLSDWRVDDSCRLTTLRLEEEISPPPPFALTEQDVVISDEEAQADNEVQQLETLLDAEPEFDFNYEDSDFCQDKRGLENTQQVLVEESSEVPQKVTSEVMTCDFSLGAEQDLKRRFGSDIRSALGPGTVIEGTFRFDSPVCIDGTLSGEVLSSSALIVGEQAEVDAKIKVGSLIILGRVRGDIEASDLVEIRANGCLEGDIITKRLVIEDGATFSGTCNMPEI
jgi:cytoskeletal protein CcmA (bactofilin family)